jgi:aspartate-semialdehyde dehydrogenase
MVGQRFVSILAEHPWFDVAVVAASARSAGQKYIDAVGGRWAFEWPVPEAVREMTVQDAADVEKIADQVDFIFCAVDMPKDQIPRWNPPMPGPKRRGVHNSAFRMAEDVPMMIPEINTITWPSSRRSHPTGHPVALSPASQLLYPGLRARAGAAPKIGLEKVMVATYQAISGAARPYVSSRDGGQRHFPSSR